MASLIVLPSTTNAFSEYRPSTNAHNDFLSPNALGKRRESEKTGPTSIRLNLGLSICDPPVKDQLSVLLTSIPLLLAGNPTTESYHHLSAICHKLVLPPHSLGTSIYGAVRDELERSVAGMAREWRAAIMGRAGGWLGKLIHGWKAWEKRVALLSAVFVYLDRVYSNELNGTKSIRELAIITFRKGIWENEILFGKTRDDVLAWATSERENATPDEATRPTILSIISLSKLLTTFDTLSKPYLELTQSHYSDIVSQHLSSVDAGTMSPTRYVEWLLQKVDEEHTRTAVYIDPDVANTARTTIRREGGEQVKDRIIRRALDEAMDHTDGPALTQLYKFSVDCMVFSTFRQSLQDHIEDRLKKLISDPANDPQMIDGTLTLKRFADRSVKDLFIRGIKEDRDEDMPSSVKEEPPVGLSLVERQRQLELEDAVRVGFKAGMGSRQNAPAEWIAKHLDVAMRKGQGSGTETEFNALLDEIIALIGFTRDKDVFKAFYSTQLAKRLLLNKSASDDMERNMILKLQSEMGEEFTSGDIMMKDLTLSDTLVKSYQSAQAKSPDDFKDAGNFTANVLTESAWPAYPLLKDGWNFKLTPDLQSSIDQFTKWYAIQHKNRQLSWRWQLATVSLTARFPSGKYEVGVSLFQAVTLMQFNEEDSLKFKELKDRTGIEQSELVRTIQSLSLGRKGTRVLVKKPPGKEVKPDDIIAWNKQFTSERIKFRINQIQQDMSAEESRKTNEQVAIDRVSVLEATIVRIMKARKKMTLQLLIDAVVSDVSKRFPPDVKEIKKRMESLIEREFLMRDEDDRNLLHYLA